MAPDPAEPPVRDLPRLAGERVLLRPLARADRGPLGRIFADPEVARWWVTTTTERALDELYSDPAVFAIEFDGAVIGAIEYDEEDAEDYRHAGIDIFVGAAHQNRGLGTDAVRTLARHLLRDRGHHRLTIDPAASNERAIRAYSKVGFRPVGIMRQYERGPDGTWHDGLLMDLLAGELTDGEAR